MTQSEHKRSTCAIRAAFESWYINTGTYHDFKELMDSAYKAGCLNGEVDSHDWHSYHTVSFAGKDQVIKREEWRCYSCGKTEIEDPTKKPA